MRTLKKSEKKRKRKQRNVRAREENRESKKKKKPKRDIRTCIPKAIVQGRRDERMGKSKNKRWGEREEKHGIWLESDAEVCPAVRKQQTQRRTRARTHIRAQGKHTLTTASQRSLKLLGDSTRFSMHL